MRGIGQWLLASGIFVAVNVLCAGIIFVALKGLQLASPTLAEQPWATYPVGIAGLALGLWVSWRIFAAVGKAVTGRDP